MPRNFEIGKICFILFANKLVLIGNFTFKLFLFNLKLMCFLKLLIVLRYDKILVTFYNSSRNCSTNKIAFKYIDFVFNTVLVCHKTGKNADQSQ